MVDNQRDLKKTRTETSCTGLNDLPLSISSWNPERSCATGAGIGVYEDCFLRKLGYGLNL